MPNDRVVVTERSFFLTHNNLMRVSNSPLKLKKNLFINMYHTFLALTCEKIILKKNSDAFIISKSKFILANKRVNFHQILISNLSHHQHLLPNIFISNLAINVDIIRKIKPAGRTKILHIKNTQNTITPKYKRIKNVKKSR